MILRYIALLAAISLSLAQVNSGITISLNSTNLGNLSKEAATILEEPLKGVSVPIIIPNFKVNIDERKAFLIKMKGETSSYFTEDSKMVVSLKNTSIEGLFPSSLLSSNNSIFKESSTIALQILGDFKFTGKLNSLYGEETALSFKTVEAVNPKIGISCKGYFSSKIESDLQNAFSQNMNSLLSQMGKTLFNEKLTIFLRKARISITSSLKLDLSMADEKLNLKNNQFTFYPLGTVFSSTSRIEPKGSVPANFEDLAQGEARITISKFPFESFLFSVISKNKFVKIDKNTQPNSDFTTYQLENAVDSSISEIPNSVFRLEIILSPGKTSFAEGNQILFTINTETSLYATNKEGKDQKFIEGIKGNLTFISEYSTKFNKYLSFSSKRAFSLVEFIKKDKITDEARLSEVLKPFFDKLIAETDKGLLVDLPLHQIIAYGNPEISLKDDNLEVKVAAPIEK